jgi:F-type H+-transporting ATPase subunit b
MKADLDEAMARADAQIAEKTAESEKRIGEIRAGAMESVEAVAKDTAGALAAALGTQASDAEIAAAVDAQMKG